MKTKIILMISAALCAIMLLVMVLVLTLGRKTGFVPPAFDSSAQKGVPNVPDTLGYSQLSREGMSFSAGVCGKVITNEDGSADVYLTNYAGNDVWMKLRIYDINGNVLGETGLIKQGEYVKSIALSDCPPAGSKITMKIMTYEPETYYSAGAVNLNTTID